MIDDPVNHPPHYQRGNLECIDAITAAVEDKRGLEAVCVANVIKYLTLKKNQHVARRIMDYHWGSAQAKQGA